MSPLARAFPPQTALAVGLAFVIAPRELLLVADDVAAEFHAVEAPFFQLGQLLR